MSLMVFSQPFIMILEGFHFKELFFYCDNLFFYQPSQGYILRYMKGLRIVCFISSVYLTLCQTFG